MLKLKQVLQGRIVLLLLGGIVLGTIPFSMTACEGVKLSNQVINLFQPEQEAKQNIGAIMRAQSAYRLENGKFSSYLQQLGVGSATNSENYSYRIYRGIQTTLNNYLFLNLDKTTIKTLKFPEDDLFAPFNKLPRISSDIVMITAQPTKAGLKTYIGFVFSCDMDSHTGTADCPDDTAGDFIMLYKSEQPFTPPPSRMKVSLPLAYCDIKGCLREKVPTPEGFRPVEDTN
jgi:type II secretory pathway pseudopilin PulG